MVLVWLTRLRVYHTSLSLTTFIIPSNCLYLGYPVDSKQYGSRWNFYFCNQSPHWFWNHWSLNPGSYCAKPLSRWSHSMTHLGSQLNPAIAGATDEQWIQLSFTWSGKAYSLNVAESDRYGTNTDSIWSCYNCLNVSIVYLIWKLLSKNKPAFLPNDRRSWVSSRESFLQMKWLCKYTQYSSHSPLAFLMMGDRTN